MVVEKWVPHLLGPVCVRTAEAEAHSNGDDMQQVRVRGEAILRRDMWVTVFVNAFLSVA